MPNTYTELLKTTVGTATPSVTLDLTGISGYTDLVLVYNGTVTVTGKDIRFQFNGDTATNYSYTNVGGNGSTASSARLANSTYIPTYALVGTSTSPATIAINIFNYSNTTTFKTALVRTSDAPSEVQAYAGLWRNTAAINSIRIFPNTDNFAVGSTFSLYGIANADQGAAKATGGIITEDSQYWYHTFGASGTFIPKQSLTCDVLVVAGGGAGGCASVRGGGGGAGGLLFYSAESVTATSYNVTIGGGGLGRTFASGLANTAGSNSSFGALTAATGGGRGGGGNGGASINGGTGGSGGGGQGPDGTGGSGNAGGSNGGAGQSGVSNAGGGGGKGGAGANGTAGGGGAGGVGSSVYSSWGLATGTGQNVSGTVYYAGGGGGGGVSVNGAGGFGGGTAGGTEGTNAPANTGGGSGGAGGSGGTSNGGSGIVIVRYAK
jgi:hypothetical protein